MQSVAFKEFKTKRMPAWIMVATQLEKLRADIEGTRLRQPRQPDDTLTELVRVINERRLLKGE